MTANDYTFRRVARADVPQIRELLNTVLKADLSLAHLEAKYFGNPAGDALSAVAVAGGRVVGQLGAVPVRFRAAGRGALGSQELDLAVYEEHRRFDVFLRLSHLQEKIYRENNVDFSFSFTSGLSSEITQVFAVMKVVSPIPRLVKVLDARPFLAERLPAPGLAGLAAPAANLALRLKHRAAAAPPPGMAIRPVERFDERFDRLFARVAGDYPIAAERTSAYLNWRYFGDTHIRYEAFSLEERDGEVAGFSVLAEGAGEYLAGQIFEIVTPRAGDPAAARALVGHAVDRFRRRKAAMVKAWFHEHTHVFAALADAGFVPRPKAGRDILFKGVAGRDEPAVSTELGATCANWFLTKGDSDNY